MDAILTPTRPLRGSVTVPSDKAITHRVLLASALAHGRTRVRPWSSADDCQQTLGLIQALGVNTRLVGDSLEVDGSGLEGLRAPQRELSCGESGTTLRLSAGLLAGQPFRCRLNAASSLSRRPMRRIVEPLSRMGAAIGGADGSDRRELYPPLTIEGRRPLTPISYTMPVASAQVKSAILLAGLFASGRTTVVEPLPTRDHTERVLRAFNAAVHHEGPAVTVEPPGTLRSPGQVTIPGDLSSAAFLLVAAACVGGSELEIREVGLNPTRAKILEVLQRMGASIEVEHLEDPWEPRGHVRVKSSALRGTSVEPGEVPGLIDELPLLMVAACCAQGKTVLKGIGELRVKETDRIHSMMEGLGRLGGSLQLVGPDELHINPSRLVGATVESRGDHRTAMALAVAGLIAEGSTRVVGAECVRKSFGEFFDILRAVTKAEAVRTLDTSQPRHH